MSKIKNLRKLAQDCRDAAKIYEEKPGLAGGANAGTISDMYLTIARLAELMAEKDAR